MANSKFKLFHIVSFMLLLWMAGTALGFAASASGSRQFMVVSDIHFDPFLFCNVGSPCPLIDKLSMAQPAQWDAILGDEMKMAAKYGEDTNYETLKSAMAELKKRAQLERPQFILILGDFIAHNYLQKFKQYSSDKSQKAYQDFVRKTYQFLTLHLNRSFQKIDVYAVVGNHETYEGSYAVDRDGDYYHDMKAIWAQLIKNSRSQAEFQRTFGLDGFYAINLPQQENLKIIALNTLIFSSRAHGAEVAKAADEQLSWLHGELEAAAIKHQKVLIIDHIPDGVDVYSSLKDGKFTMTTLYKSEYTERFEAEIKQFAPVIVGILAGHFHMDWFQVLTYGDVKLPVSGVPSISPLVGNNPGYKIYQYSAKTLALQNYKTYYLPFTATDKWSLMYDFNDTYQPECGDCTLLQGMQGIEKTGYMADQYQYNFNLRSNARNLSDWLPYYWCDLFTVKTAEYQNCLSSM